ncbi:MAG: magnesium transporter [Flavobacteriaceae bacterium]|jgi:magnesium transporter
MTWIDLENPTSEEITFIMEEYTIPPVIAYELKSKSVRSKVERFENLLYLVLHFPLVEHAHCDNREQEVDFIIGNDVIITTHYEHIDFIHEFSKSLEVETILERDDLGTHAGYLFFYIMKGAYTHLLDELDHLSTKLSQIEENIFSKKEKQMVIEISFLNRTLLNFKKAIRFHDDILTSLSQNKNSLFDEKFTHYISSLMGEYTKVRNQLDAHKEVLDELRQTNNTLLSTKSTEIQKTLTVAAATMLPATLVFTALPVVISLDIITSAQELYAVFIGTGVLVIYTFIYFKIRKWF